MPGRLWEFMAAQASTSPAKSVCQRVLLLGRWINDAYAHSLWIADACSAHCLCRIGLLAIKATSGRPEGYLGSVKRPTERGLVGTHAALSTRAALAYGRASDILRAHC